MVLDGRARTAAGAAGSIRGQPAHAGEEETPKRILPDATGGGPSCTTPPWVTCTIGCWVPGAGWRSGCYGLLPTGRKRLLTSLRGPGRPRRPLPQADQGADRHPGPARSPDAIEPRRPAKGLRLPLHLSRHPTQQPVRRHAPSHLEAAAGLWQTGPLPGRRPRWRNRPRPSRGRPGQAGPLASANTAPVCRITRNPGASVPCGQSQYSPPKMRKTQFSGSTSVIEHAISVDSRQGSFNKPSDPLLTG